MCSQEQRRMMHVNQERKAKDQTFFILNQVNAPDGPYLGDVFEIFSANSTFGEVLQVVNRHLREVWRVPLSL